MRQRLAIILTFVVIIGLLVILNTLTYVKQDKTEDKEINPNRSTYHAGPTGTRALHDFLNESGYKVIRWREAPEKLMSNSGQLVTTFVVVGPTRVSFTEDEAVALSHWVARGGRFVLIDRAVDPALTPKSGTWTINSTELALPTVDVNPADASQMTRDVTALQPVQPTILTRGVDSVMPSRFASRLSIIASTREEFDPTDLTSEGDPVTTGNPVVHIADQSGALLVDYSYGLGSIVVLSDPYIVANGGIRLNDNLQLAINTLARREGLIAFDEYHQGRGITQNAFAHYFAGTPVLPLAAQIIVLVLLVLWTNARRFGRPLPLPQVDRRSSLEFVASMAELQERSRAFDLAIENIYT